MINDWTEADDVIEEVREIRRQISARFDHDPRKLGAYIRELEEHYTGPMISLATGDTEEKPAAGSTALHQTKDRAASSPPG